jgi:hypothetical protein
LEVTNHKGKGLMNGVSAITKETLGHKLDPRPGSHMRLEGVDSSLGEETCPHQTEN